MEVLAILVLALVFFLSPLRLTIKPPFIRWEKIQVKEEWDGRISKPTPAQTMQRAQSQVGPNAIIVGNAGMVSLPDALIDGKTSEEVESFKDDLFEVVTRTK